MSGICVKAEHISKRFLVFKKRVTLFKTVQAIMGGESLKRELWALSDISFELNKGQKLAVVGKNGAGKTTLLRIMAGIYEQSTGALKLDKNPMAIFKLLIGLNSNLPVVDNIYLIGGMYGISKRRLREKESEILRLAELEDLKFSLLKTLSTGQQQRLALSVFFQASGDFFLFDESTAFVDMGFAHKCERYFDKLFASQTTVIIASHDMALLKKYCSRAIWLDGGRMRMSGEIEKVLNEYERVSVE
jgi:ABC-2 type transport system ATP-binding protein